MKKEYVRGMANATLPRFHSLMNRLLAEKPIRLTQRENELTHTVNLVERILPDENSEKLVSRLVKIAHAQVKEGDLITGMRMLKELARYYIDDDFSRIPSELGEQIILETRLLARTWFLAVALDICRENVAEFEESFKRLGIGTGELHDYGTRRPFFFLSAPVAGLGLTGEISDLVPLGVVVENCGFSTLEISSSQAASDIKLREAIKFSISRWDETKRKEMGISDNRLTDNQIAHRIKFVMEEMGLSPILSMLPSLQPFGSGIYSPLDVPLKITEIKRIITGGFSQGLSLSVEFIMFNNSSDHKGHAASKEFFISNEFVRRLVGERQRPYILTEKGERLIRGILEEIGKAEFKEEQEGITGGPTILLPGPNQTL